MSDASKRARRWADTLCSRFKVPLRAEDQHELGSLLATLAGEVEQAERDAEEARETAHARECVLTSRRAWVSP